MDLTMAAIVWSVAICILAVVILSALFFPMNAVIPDKEPPKQEPILHRINTMMIDGAEISALSSWWLAHFQVAHDFDVSCLNLKLSILQSRNEDGSFNSEIVCGCGEKFNFSSKKVDDTQPNN